MDWSLRIARIFGIDIKVHAAFALLLLLAWVNYYSASQDAVFALQGPLFVSLIFFCVVLHELGHSYFAIRYGGKVKDIVLLPFGGVARISKMPESPMHEVIVALGGPAVNFAIVALLLVAGIKFSDAGNDLPVLGKNMLPNLLYVNVTLGLFNLIPAFPMDGGRVLRGFLGMAGMPLVSATHFTAKLGRALALLAMIAWLMEWDLWPGFRMMDGFFLGIVMVFIFMVSVQEERAVMLQAVLRGLKVGQVMSPNPICLQPGSTLLVALGFAVKNAQEDFPVLRDGALVGLLCKKHLMENAASGNVEALVGQVMRKDPPTVSPDQSLYRAYDVMEGSMLEVLPVVKDGKLEGLIALDQIGRYLSYQGRLRQEEF